MASGTSTAAAAAAAALLLPLLVLVLFAAGGAGADDGAIEFSPPRARRAGPPVPVDGVVRAEKAGTNCPLIRVPDLVDACRSAPGLPACAAQCIVYHYRGGYCDMQSNGRPGDCYCTNCLATPAGGVASRHLGLARDDSKNHHQGHGKNTY